MPQSCLPYPFRRLQREQKKEGRRPGSRGFWRGPRRFWRLRSACRRTTTARLRGRLWTSGSFWLRSKRGSSCLWASSERSSVRRVWGCSRESRRFWRVRSPCSRRAAARLRGRLWPGDGCVCGVIGWVDTASSMLECTHECTMCDEIQSVTSGACMGALP